jgi:hypothetical protein
MSFATDILLGSDGDLPIENVDFTIGNSDQQHLMDAMLAAPGWWKQYPQNGIAINSYFKSRVQPLKVLAKVKKELEKDGYTLVNPSVPFTMGTMGVIPNAIRT